MTNKVIIDYTKCKYYHKGECEAEIDYNGNYCDYTCESDVMKDCYYKQLQRKTQECEKLKAEMKQIKKDLRKRFSVQNVSDGEITCSKKQTCYAHLHAYEAMSAYCRADKSLSCYNCPEKERCEIQKRQKNEVIDLIIDRIHKITNYDSCITPHIKKLKSVIPTVTRCDVVLEKQLQRKTQECEKLKEEAIYGYVGDLSNKLRAKVFKDLKEENQKYKSALDEIEEFCLVYRDNPVEGSAYKKILDIITKTKEQE